MKTAQEPNRTAVRLHQTTNLLPTAERTRTGDRVHRDGPVARRFIRQAKTLGLTHTEIGDILDTRQGVTPPCPHVLQLLDQRLADVDRTIAELRQLRRALAASREYAATQAPTPDSICGVIEHSRRR